MDEILGRFGKAFAQELAKELAKELRASNDEWISQLGSPLGSRRHCAAVRRRMAEGKADATKKSKLYLMSKEALREEMLRLGTLRPPVKAESPAQNGPSTEEPETSVRGRLLRKLGRA